MNVQESLECKLEKLGFWDIKELDLDQDLLKKVMN